MIECELGARKKTYRDIRLFLCSKATGGCAVETGCNNRLSNLGWTRCNGMQAIVTHGMFSTDLHRWEIMPRNGERYLDRRQNIDGLLAGLRHPCEQKLRAT